MRRPGKDLSCTVPPLVRPAEAADTRRKFGVQGDIPGPGKRGRGLTALRGLVFAGVLGLGVATAARAKEPPPPPLDFVEMTLEELMSVEITSIDGVSGFFQKAAEAPASVSIVTADDIRTYGYRTLADILRSVRGMYVSYDRNYSYLGTRGLSRPADYNTRILVLIDGHRLNDNVYDMAPLGTEFPIDVDLMQRVVVIRGPSSALYGSNAFFAIVNVITTAGHLLNGAEGSLELGSLGTGRGRASFGRRLANGAEVAVSATAYGSAGQRLLYFKEFDTPETNHGIAANADRDRAGSVFGKAGLGDLVLGGAYQWRQKHLPTASFGTAFDDPDTRTLDQRGYLDLQYSRRFGNRLGCTARVYYDLYQYDADLMYAPAEGDGLPPVLNKDLGRGDWWGAELRLTRKFASAHRLAAGTEYRGNVRQEQRNFDVDPGFVYMDDHRTSKVWALYLVDEIGLLPDLTLSAGLRHDHYDGFGGTTNPRLGLVCTPSPGTTLKALYGNAFRAPNLYELYYSGSGLKANPGLKPEKIRSVELSAEQRIGAALRVMVSGFHNDMDDLISQQTDETDGNSVFRNFEQVYARGIEAELIGAWANGTQARLGYTLQRTRVDPGDQLPSNSPSQLVKLGLAAPLFSPLMTAGLDLQFIDRRQSLAHHTVPSTWVASVTFQRRDLLKGLDASLTIQNALDATYGYPGSEEHAQDVIYQDGRTALVRLTYRAR